MFGDATARSIKILCAAVIIATVSLAGIECLPFHSAHVFAAKAAAVLAPVPAQADPWPASQTIQPAELLKELGQSKAANRPVVVCVGFRPLYMGAHVPGAVFHGAAQSESGLADLKRWAQGVPHSATVVVYCGCCPLEHCPNIRPAYIALRDMGFTNLRVLVLPHDFATDWVEKGYPVEKGVSRDSKATP